MKTLQDALKVGEAVDIEFKSWIKTSSMKERISLAVDELIAFANCKGGTVYFGVEDDGEVTGCTGKYDLQSICESIYDKTRPPMFTDIEEIEYDGKDNLEEYNARIDMKQPIITILDRLTEKIENENKIRLVQIGLFRLEVADFSTKVFQEALLNALSHRDYQQQGAVYVKHYSDKVIIENPGGFLDGITADNIITHPSSPRNKLIAETLQNLRYVQRTGQGVDIIYKEMVTMGKPYPIYRMFNDAVQLTIGSAMEEPNFVEFIIKEQDTKQITFSLAQLMILRYIAENRKITLSEVKKVAQISDDEARKCCSDLMRLGLIENIAKEYMLTARVYEAVKSDVEYTRDKTVQYIKAKDMIVEYIKKHGFINRMTVQELCGFSNQQARRTIEKMRKENIIVMSSGGKYAKYIMVEP